MAQEEPQEAGWGAWRGGPLAVGNSPQHLPSPRHEVEVGGGDRSPSGHRRQDGGSRAPRKCSAWPWLRVRRGWLLAPVPSLTSGTEPCPSCGPGPKREAAWPDLPSSAPAPRARGQACCVAAGCGRWWDRREPACGSSALSGLSRGYRRALFSNKQVEGLLFLSIIPSFFPAEQRGRRSHLLTIFTRLKKAPSDYLKPPGASAVRIFTHWTWEVQAPLPFRSRPFSLLPGEVGGRGPAAAGICRASLEPSGWC